MEVWGQKALLYASDAWVMLTILREARTDCKRILRALGVLTAVVESTKTDWNTCHHQHRASVSAYVRARSNFFAAVTQTLAFKDVLRGAVGETYDSIRECMDLLIAGSKQEDKADIATAVNSLLASLTVACERLRAAPLDDRAMQDYVSACDQPCTPSWTRFSNFEIFKMHPHLRRCTPMHGHDATAFQETIQQIAQMPCFYSLLLEELSMMKHDESLVMCGKVETFDDVQAAIMALPPDVSHGLLINVAREDTPNIDENSFLHVGVQRHTREYARYGGPFSFNSVMESAVQLLATQLADRMRPSVQLPPAAVWCSVVAATLSCALLVEGCAVRLTTMGRLPVSCQDWYGQQFFTIHDMSMPPIPPSAVTMCGSMATGLRGSDRSHAIMSLLVTGAPRVWMFDSPETSRVLQCPGTTMYVRAGVTFRVISAGITVTVDKII